MRLILLSLIASSLSRSDDPNSAFAHREDRCDVNFVDVSHSYLALLDIAACSQKQVVVCKYFSSVNKVDSMLSDCRLALFLVPFEHEVQPLI
jgi:hypothetical protein